jgi:hypothetical protein
MAKLKREHTQNRPSKAFLYSLEQYGKWEEERDGKMGTQAGEVCAAHYEVQESRERKNKHAEFKVTLIGSKLARLR